MDLPQGAGHPDGGDGPKSRGAGGQRRGRLIEPPDWGLIYRNLAKFYGWTFRDVDDLEVTRFLEAILLDRKDRPEPEGPPVPVDRARLRRLALEAAGRT